MCMRNDFLTDTEVMEERLAVLKSLDHPNDYFEASKIRGEIKYIENMLSAAAFSTFNDYPLL